MEWAGPHGTLESGVKIASLQFLPASFLTKTCHICIAKKQRAVRGAACLRFRGKIARCGLHILTAGFNCNMLQKKLTKHGNQFGVQRKANPYENPHWSGTNEVSLISYSATPRAFRRICLGAEHQTDFRICNFMTLSFFSYILYNVCHENANI